MSYPDPAFRDKAIPEIFIVLMVFVLAVFALKFIGELPCRDAKPKPKAVPTKPLLPKPPFKPRTKPGIRMDRVDRVALHQYSR